MTIHPRHEEARFRMAERLARLFYDNQFSSDFLSIAGDRFWKEVPRAAGEKHTPSPETRHLTLEILLDLEAKRPPRGPSLEEIAGARDSSSWTAPAPDTTSDGPRPNPVQRASQSDSGPSELSEAPVAGTQGNHEEVPSSSSRASEDVCPPAGIGLSESPRGGQVSLPFQPHSETSRLAAHDQDTKDVAKAHRLLVLQTLRELGPLTDDQIADHLGLTTEQVRVRRIGLVHDRYVEQAGRGLSRKGRPCNTWGLTEYAVSA